jgi:hypothetical protein
MQRVFEIQANWDERQKLRHFAISRPPVRPPWPIVAPGYRPDQVSLYGLPSQDQNRVNNNPHNNSGHAAFSFLENKDKKLVDNKNQEKIKLISEKNSIEKEIHKTLEEIKKIKDEKKFNQLQVIEYDYDSKSKEICEIIKQTSSKNTDIVKVRKMIQGKTSKQINSLVEMLKKHPEIISSNNNLRSDKFQEKIPDHSSKLKQVEALKKI